MKGKRKALALSLACVLTFGGLASACTVDNPYLNGGTVIDETKTQLYVGVYNGALGYEYLVEYKEMYEAKHPEVQVIIDNKKAEYDSVLTTKMPNNRQDLYFLSHNSYYDFCRAGILEDLTDTISEKTYDANMNLVASGGTNSILDSMYDDFKPIYERDGRYYAIPNFMSPAGVFYDAQLFEEMDYEVPETYNELISLMNTMVLDEITPFCFSGMLYIVTNALSGVWASYEGANDYNLNNTFNGTDSTLGEITEQNGYILQQQEGKKAALKFAYDLMHNSAYTTAKTAAGSLGNEGAQQEYVKSINTTATKSNRVAMFMESSYWEPEVKDYMNSLATINQEWGWGKREFKFMSFPKFVGVEGIADQTNDKTTVFAANTRSMVCINKASDQKELAKDFLQFCQSREALAIYVKYTSSLRPYKFAMNESEYAACTTLGQSIYDLTQDENVEFVGNHDLSPLKQKQNTEWYHMWSFQTTGKKTSQIPTQAFYTDKSLSVAEYFAGMSTYWSQSYWNNNMLG